MKIGGHGISYGNPCFIIAEMGMTHFGDVDRALSMVEPLARSGANAIKTQMINVDACFAGENEWKERLRSRALSLGSLRKIKEKCDKHDILFFATPHDEAVLPWVLELDMPVVKIGSGEVGNTKFIKKAAALNKPMIISFGMHNAVDKYEANEACGDNIPILMHCISKYPTPLEEASLGSISSLIDMNRSPAIRMAEYVGYSDHTIGSLASVMAIALGACVIEKHVTTNYGRGREDANDWRVSIDVGMFGAFVNDIRMAEQAMRQQPIPDLIWARKSLVVKNRLAKGVDIARIDLTAKRPGIGISPRDWNLVVGKRTTQDIEPDTTLTWEMLRK